jgi:hypothetical protein
MSGGFSGEGGGALSYQLRFFNDDSLANLSRWRKASDRLVVDACTGRRVSWARCVTLVRLTCPLPDRR